MNEWVQIFFHSIARFQLQGSLSSNFQPDLVLDPRFEQVTQSWCELNMMWTDTNMPAKWFTIPYVHFVVHIFNCTAPFGPCYCTYLTCGWNHIWKKKKHQAAKRETRHLNRNSMFFGSRLSSLGVINYRIHKCIVFGNINMS